MQLKILNCLLTRKILYYIVISLCFTGDLVRGLHSEIRFFYCLLA